MPRPLAALAVTAFVLAGCDASAPPLAAEDVAGTYTAEFFDLYRTAADGGSESVDVLARGGAAAVTLDADGTARVEVTVPAGLPGAGRLDAAATYTLRTTDVGGAVTGARVRFAGLPAPLAGGPEWTFRDGPTGRLSLGATSGEPWALADGWTGRIQLARAD